MVDSLIVGPFDVSVVEDQFPADSDERGGYDADYKFIRLAAQQSEQMKADTLVHEALHALWDVYRLPATQEEEIVDRLAPALLALFRFNPGLKDVLFG